ncbi:hypothetical protein AVEN_141668-1 [Araneus ventricosus]|uniref:Uncharacterized protein n=1 Tax=Araneus ventricosus TaxID=182803 RepID=A0A4Y2VP63_ARAVE|nr:hypothetical protein AVEN_9503-1 [Araneus ventricosus]GBO25517.1 hypothetical protein AVEN_141668-1 [Araneus ventricosus]
MDKLQSAKKKIELDEIKDVFTEPLMIDILMPNYVQLTENFSSEIDNYINAGVFEEHSHSVATSEIIHTEETSHVPIPEKYDEKTNKCQILTAEASNNHLAAENKATEEKSTTLLHEQCYLIMTDVPIPEKNDEKTSENQILPIEAVVNAPATENKVDAEKSSTFFDEKCYLQGVQILQIYDETNFECQILTEEPAVNAPAAEDKTDDEKIVFVP